MTKDDLLEFIANETYDETIDRRVIYGNWIAKSFVKDYPEYEKIFSKRRDLYNIALKESKGIKMLTDDYYAYLIYEEFKKNFFSE